MTRPDLWGDWRLARQAVFGSRIWRCKAPATLSESCGSTKIGPQELKKPDSGGEEPLTERAKKSASKAKASPESGGGGGRGLHLDELNQAVLKRRAAAETEGGPAFCIRVRCS